MSTYIHGMWFVGDGQSRDYFAKLFKADGKWTLEYRFRYYADDQHHDSKDVKNWYTAKMRDDSPESLVLALASINRVVAALVPAFGHISDYVDLQCNEDDPKVMFELGSRDWCDIKLERNVP